MWIQYSCCNGVRSVTCGRLEFQSYLIFEQIKKSSNKFLRKNFSQLETSTCQLFFSSALSLFPQVSKDSQDVQERYRYSSCLCYHLCVRFVFIVVCFGVCNNHFIIFTHILYCRSWWRSRFQIRNYSRMPRWMRSQLCR